MAVHVELDIETSLKPEQVIAAVTDFTPRRPDIWPGLAREFYEVYSVGDTEADVQEGSLKPTRIWAKEHYDWSTPGVVHWTVKESNFCTPGSYVKATVTPRDGGSNIHCEWERTATKLLYRVGFFMIKATGGKPIRQSVEPGLANYARMVSGA